MAGQPRRRKFAERVEAEGGPEAVWDRIRGGAKLREVAEHFGDTYEVFRSWVRHGGPERIAAFEAAKHESADILVEDAGDVIDELGADPSGPQVGKAKLKVDYKKWLAGTRDREQYGDRPDTVIGIHSTGDLHLNALRQRGSMELLPEPVDEPALLPAETEEN